MPLIVRFLLTCAVRDNSLNSPSLHSLASGVFNCLHISNRSPLVVSRTALMFIMSDIKFSSRTHRLMVAFVLCETIGLERFRIRVDLRSVGCGEDVAAGGCTLGTLVVSFE